MTQAAHPGPDSPAPEPCTTPFDLLGGEAAVRALVAAAPTRVPPLAAVIPAAEVIAVVAPPRPNVATADAMPAYPATAPVPAKPAAAVLTHQRPHARRAGEAR